MSTIRNALVIAVLSALAVGCGDKSDDSGFAANDVTTEQSESVNG